MILTKKELEIMTLLWTEKIPMTSAEIVAASIKRTWKDSSIHIIMKKLIDKEAVVFSSPKPTGTNNAKSYIPKISFEDYTLSTIRNMDKYGKSSKCIDYDVIIEGIMKMKEG